MELPSLGSASDSDAEGVMEKLVEVFELVESATKSAEAVDTILRQALRYVCADKNVLMQRLCVSMHAFDNVDIKTPNVNRTNER